MLVPTAAFAADTVTTTRDDTVKKGFAQHRFLNEEKREEVNNKLLELVGKYTPGELDEWKNALAEQEKFMNTLKEKSPLDKERPQLSDETKEKVKAIHEDVKNGKLTREEAYEQLKNLGIENFGDGEKFRDKPELSDEAKEKLKALHEDMQNGKITPEQAREEMENLGINDKKGLDKNDQGGQFKEAVDANDETKIKELLPQMLQQLKEKNQDLSNKLAEANN